MTGWSDAYDIEGAKATLTSKASQVLGWIGLPQAAFSLAARAISPAVRAFRWHRQVQGSCVFV
jgi:hypothetical protein